jgi:hypothetical protein
MSSTGLAVVECRWGEEGNDSVRPLFETLSAIVEGNPHGYRYDMFSEETSLAYVIEEIADTRDYHSVYIASHGDENEISGMGNARISRAKLRNLFRRVNKGNDISGLYFGSCLIANVGTAAFLLTGASATNLVWIAGYSEKVDWIDSSAIDMVFCSKYLEERKENRRRRRRKHSELEMVKAASRAMKRLMPTVFDQLGFNIYYLDTGGALAAAW